LAGNSKTLSSRFATSILSGAAWRETIQRSQTEGSAGSKEIEMVRTPILVAAIAAMIGGGLYYHDRTKLNGLQCEIVDTETPYGSGSSKTVKPAVTWLIELSSKQWRLAAINGVPMTELINSNNKDKNKDNVGAFLPLRTTDESYVLMEKDEHKSDNFSFNSPPLIINRITGELFGSQTVTDQTTHWSSTTESKGHCALIHIGATL
jgi:hypothetical protein